jgi:hypothetical protein
MLDVSNRAVNENALGDASVRGALSDHAAIAQGDDASGQCASEGRVAQPNHDGVARVTTLIDPGSDTRRLRVADVDQVNHRLVLEARLGERRAMEMQTRPLQGHGARAVPKPFHRAGVGSEEAGRAEQQRRLAGPAGSNHGDRLTRGGFEVDVDDRLRARQTRTVAGDESFGESGDLERRAHADR